MNRAKLLNIVVFITIMTFYLLPHNVLAEDNNDLNMDYTVTSSPSTVVKPPNENAKASIDFNIIPKGEVKEQNRPPLDVIFVFDKSGSMDENKKNPSKLNNAKEGLANAVHFFEKHAQESDRFGLITFSSQVETVIGLNSDLDQIKNSVWNISALGGTNYTQPLRAAKDLLKESSNEKYIIFLTDGDPMIANSIEKVRYEKCVDEWWIFCTEKERVEENKEVFFDYQYSPGWNSWNHKIYVKNSSDIDDLYINGFTIDNTTFTSGWYSMNSLGNSDKKMKALIKKKGFDVAKELYTHNITMHTIGYGNSNKELDENYLELLANTTAGTYSKANESTITNKFENLAEKINGVKVNGEAIVDISNFDGNVVIDSNKYTVKGSKVYIPFSIDYEKGKGAPSPFSLSLPVEFKNEGKYVFDNIQIRYKNSDKEEWHYADKKSVTVEVKSDAPGLITGNIELKKINNELFDLVIEENKKTNKFTASYHLSFSGLVNEQAIGKLKDIVIYQPLPEGIIPLDDSKITVKEIEGKKTAVISLNKEVPYENGKYNLLSTTEEVTFKAEWAIYNQKMPQASVHYVDSRYRKSTSSNLKVNSDEISAKVRERQWINGEEYAYDGYSDGTIKKVRLPNQTVAIIEQPNDTFPQKPIKNIKTESIDLNITYFDNDKTKLSLVPGIVITKEDSKEIVNNGNSVSSAVEFGLDKLVSGDNVTYYYQLENEEGVSEWTGLSPQQKIKVDYFGENIVRVKAVGGFAIEDYIITKSFSIEGDELIRVPDKIELYVDETQAFEVDIFPFGKPNRNYNVKVLEGEDGSINSQYNWDQSNKQNKITGISPGTDLVEVETKNGKHQKYITVIVKDKYIELEGLQFKQSKYKLSLQNAELNVNNELLYSPQEATNKNLFNVTSTKEGILEIDEKNGEWFVKPKKEGFTTIIATPEDNKNISAVTIVEVTKNGTISNPIDGRW
jgi:hypothetical protein